MVRPFACIAALSVVAAAPAPAPTCADVRKLVTSAAACTGAAHGVVTAPEQAEADRLAGYAAAGEARFQRYFGAPAPAWAILQGGTQAEARGLKEIGIARALAWPTNAQWAEAASASVARGAEAQAKAKGLSPEQIATVVAQAKAQWLARNNGAQRQANESGALPHELGHLWLIERYWPGAKVDTGGHYGGPGPDWLDETAAVLMEDEPMTAGRRKQFWRGIADDLALKASVGITAAALLDLERFFAEDHPMRATQERMRGDLGAQGMRVLTGEEAKQAAQGAVTFYLQSRMFADWALVQSGNPRLFGDIAKALGGGQTFDAWLASNGKRNKLGATSAEVAQSWRAWVQASRPSS